MDKGSKEAGDKFDSVHWLEHLIYIWWCLELDREVHFGHVEFEVAKDEVEYVD